MMDLFALAEKRHEEITKEAALGALASVGGSLVRSAGKALWNNKGKALTVGLTAMELGSGAANGARVAAKGGVAKTFTVGPSAQF